MVEFQSIVTGIVGAGAGIGGIPVDWHWNCRSGDWNWWKYYPPADRILVQTRHTDAIKARAACATVGETSCRIVTYTVAGHYQPQRHITLLRLALALACTNS